jgi:hypothetical protein
MSGGTRADRGARLARRAGRRRPFADSGLIQRATCEAGLLGASRLVNNTGEGFTNGGPSSWQSDAVASGVLRDASLHATGAAWVQCGSNVVELVELAGRLSNPAFVRALRMLLG